MIMQRLLKFIPALALLLSQAVLAEYPVDDAQRYRHKYPIQPLDDSLQVEVVDARGHPLPYYPQWQRNNDGTRRAYLEARRGEQYAIQVQNRSASRIGLVIAVDGRNIISGKPSELRADERMYVLEPYQQASFRGWRSGTDHINAFYFTEAADSYAGRWGDYSAMGVIAIASYREREIQQRPQLSAPDGAQSRRRAAPESQQQPGTGYGDRRYDPTRSVRFIPGPPMQRVVLRYQWPETLCQQGIAPCERSRRRFWDEPSDYGGEFAPPPPGRRW